MDEHLLGDQALCAAARVVPLHLRAVDHFGRWGGEEFAILLPRFPIIGMRCTIRLHPNTRRIIPAFSLAALFALALALRLYRIDAQSFWYDEGLTVALAVRPLDDIARAAAADVHPPLYYWLLHGWLRLTGTGEAAARAFSAVCGAMTVVLTAILGWRWFGAAAGWLAGIAAAVSPFAIHYSQETRMYALAMLLATCLWLALEAIGWKRMSDRAVDLSHAARFPWRWMLIYGAAALAALSTHYFMVAFVATTALTGAILLRRRAQLAWIAGHLALVGFFLALVWNSRERLAVWTFAKQPTEPLFILSDTLRVFCLGPAAPSASWIWIIGFTALLAAALASWRASPAATGKALAWLVVPLATIIVLSLNQPYYKPRFLLPALPAFHLLLGFGAAALVHSATQRFGVRRGIGVGVLTAAWLVAAAATPLRNEWFNPAFQRDDYRGLARAVAATARPDDAILLIGPGQIDVFDYYFKGSQIRYPLPRFRPLDTAATVAELEQIAQRHRRVYGVFYVPYEADPNGVVNSWLAERAFRAESRWYGGVELAVYELGNAGAPLRNVDVRFGNTLILERVAISSTRIAGGDAVRIELHWRVVASPERDLFLFAHLLDINNRIVAQHDGPLARIPTSAWQPGETYRSRAAVLAPPGAPPATYRLVIGVYDPRTGERLRLKDGRDGWRVDEFCAECSGSLLQARVGAGADGHHLR
ncbi:MAG: glycosyltransferase family 39 protein [Roseiflexus sp.]|nr:glycosyltransferase family 39 protein [Roseiflexus sp.]MCS7289712.1 glycosyltransferase family 39 protein [Roseiflexus sp.]MDW8148740.1 glycosyltransferase family 39 protein [Roseiflexaceae bacterium]MDW8233130.1 glycosyltransferase family 39 protein [Roseiflexaceae bacterium]